MALNAAELNQEELDVLLMLYLAADQYGKVNMKIAKYLAKTKFTIDMSDNQIYLSQRHIDALILRGLIPDSSEIIQKMKFPWPRFE